VSESDDDVETQRNASKNFCLRT